MGKRLIITKNDTGTTRMPLYSVLKAVLQGALARAEQCQATSKPDNLVKTTSQQVEPLLMREARNHCEDGATSNKAEAAFEFGAASRASAHLAR